METDLLHSLLGPTVNSTHNYNTGRGDIGIGEKARLDTGMSDTLHLCHYCTHKQRMSLEMQRHTHFTGNNISPPISLSVLALPQHESVNSITYVAYTNKGMKIDLTFEGTTVTAIMKECCVVIFQLT